MPIPPSTLGDDAEKVFLELQNGPMGYRLIKQKLGDDADRAIAAIDHLRDLGEVEEVVIAGNTHYFPANSPHFLPIVDVMP